MSTKLENMKSEYIVSVEWLNSNLDKEKIVVLDASLKPITAGLEKNADQFVAIPNALRFDLKEVFCDKTSPFDHTLPSTKDFIINMGLLGISDDSIIVIYDNQGIYSSSRVWFMIKSMGHKEVYVLDGGLPEWIDKGFLVVDYINDSTVKGSFSNRSAAPGFSWFCDSKKVLNSITCLQSTIIDSRSQKRFLGLVPEPRPFLKSGHIPNSINLPFENVLNKSRFKDEQELRSMFSDHANKNITVIFSCGSGVTSCITALAALISGCQNVLIFDGSWTEWGDPESQLPISSGQV